MFTIPNHHRGFSLIEILVAMAISLFLLAGVATMFVSSKGAYETNDRLARLEENGRFALDAIGRDIRSAGYSGCASSSTGANIHRIVNSPGGVNDNLGAIPIQGFNANGGGSWTPALPGFIPGLNPAPDNLSDILMITGPTTNSAIPLSADMTLTTDPLTVPIVAAPGSFTVGQLVMIGDCNDRSYFEVTGYTPATGAVLHAASAAGPMTFGNSTGDLGTRYGFFNPATQQASNAQSGPAQIFGVQSRVYYVALAKACQAAPKDSNCDYNSLYRATEGNVVEELIEGVDSMQLLYGLDSNPKDNPPVVNLPPTNVANAPGAIVSITISLLVRSVDQYGTTPNNRLYPLLGPSDSTANFQAPGDRRQRQVFSTTIWVRNPP